MKNTQTLVTGAGSLPRETDVVLSGRNYYAVVRGFVYTLRAFGIEHEARDFASHLYSSPSFAPEFGWTPSRKFKLR